MKKLVYIIVSLLLLFFPVVLIEEMNREKELVAYEIRNAYKLDIPYEIEYTNETIDLNQFIKSTEQTHSFIISNLPKGTLSIGEHCVNIKVVTKDKFNRDYFKILSTQFTVVDTQLPVIELESDAITITDGETLDLNFCVKRVYDKVDGDLEPSSYPSTGCYWFEDVSDTPGNYEVKLVAEDSNGNKSLKKIDVTIKEKIIYEDTTVNFDLIFTTVSGSSGPVQSLLDQGYIVQYCGDYFHHNTSMFLSLFWRCTSGTKVVLNGITYTSGGIYHGWSTDTEIYYDSGALSWYSNPDVEVITCAENNSARWILVLY